MSSLPPWVLAQQEDLWVVNKPSNVSLLGDRSGSADLWQQLQQLPGKPYLVHRLDKGTSGVLLVARSAAAQQRLTRAFAARRVHKYYLAWVLGAFPRGGTVHINLPLCRGRKSRYRVAGRRADISRSGNTFNVIQDRTGVEALTRVRCLAQTGGLSLLLVKPFHGRTHQIRVHLSWLGYPLLGDTLYGNPRAAEQQAPRLMLHCRRLVADAQTFRAAVPPGFGSADPASVNPG